MLSGKVVVFAGGMHGAGKTTLCKLLGERIGALVVRQRQQVIAAGHTLGLTTWSEIGPHHDRLIEQAAQLVVDQFLEANAQVLLVDCHYAIRAAKALRLAGRIFPDGSYIHDLDPRFVAVLRSRFHCRFLFIATTPEIALQRFASRRGDLLDADNTLPALREQITQELAFLEGLIRMFEVPESDIVFVDNSGAIEDALGSVKRFVQDHGVVPAP